MTPKNKIYTVIVGLTRARLSSSNDLNSPLLSEAIARIFSFYKLKLKSDRLLFVGRKMTWQGQWEAWGWR